MNDASTLRVSAVFSFLSPLAILGRIPFAASLGGVLVCIAALGRVMLRVAKQEARA